jgi:hypothetical protein
MVSEKRTFRNGDSYEGNYVNGKKKAMEFFSLPMALKKKEYGKMINITTILVLALQTKDLELRMKEFIYTTLQKNLNRRW